MRRIVLAAASVALVALSGRAHADEPKLAYQTFALANGLAVYVIEDHATPVVDEILWFRVGSKDEVAHRTGVAHLFEHLMFKGSAHIPDGLMDKLLEGGGGDANAFTNGDATVYQNRAAANYLETMLWLDADRLAGLTDTLDQAKLDNQRDVVLNERRQTYENQPYGISSLLIDEALWPAAHGYHGSTIGYPDDLHAAQLSDVTAFFKTYYVPNNATMVIVGDVRFADVKRLVEKYLGWIPRAPEPRRPVSAVPPPLTKQIDLAATDAVQVPRVYLTWRAPVLYGPDEPATALAAELLGGKKSSRLYQRLVYDEKIAQTVRADYEGAELGGEIQISATAKPGVDPKRLIAEITEEVGKLAATAPTALELERVQASHEATFLAGLEPLMTRAVRLGSYVVQGHDADRFPKELAAYRGVTPAQVTVAVARYMKPSARVVLTIRPGAKETR